MNCKNSFWFTFYIHKIVFSCTHTYTAFVVDASNANFSCFASARVSHFSCSQFPLVLEVACFVWWDIPECVCLCFFLYRSKNHLKLDDWIPKPPSIILYHHDSKMGIPWYTATTMVNISPPSQTVLCWEIDPRASATERCQWGGGQPFAMVIKYILQLCILYLSINITIM